MEKGKTFDLVKSILEEHPSARENDYALIRFAAKRFGFDGLTFDDAVSSWAFNKLPSFESLTRARRKVQELYPELRSEERIAEMRAEREREYREFYGR